MGRRKKPAGTKKVVASISIAPDAKEMLFVISDMKKITASELIEEYIRKEYTKLRKANKCEDVNVPGQITLPADW